MTKVSTALTGKRLPDLKREIKSNLVYAEFEAWSKRRGCRSIRSSQWVINPRPPGEGGAQRRVREVFDFSLTLISYTKYHL
jgi:hypothetical protein